MSDGTHGVEFWKVLPSGGYISRRQTPPMDYQLEFHVYDQHYRFFLFFRRFMLFESANHFVL